MGKGLKSGAMIHEKGKINSLAARGSVPILSRPLHGLNILETLFPSSELLGYYHSSALRTDNYFSGKAA
jgi:hypothetical protein